jgi:hypothetical protein
MTPQLCFWISFLFFSIFIFFLDHKYSMLRDNTMSPRKTYSFSRVQMAWWSVILFASFISVIFHSGNIPVFTGNILILMGITSGTTAAARIIDQPGGNHPQSSDCGRYRDEPSKGFIPDILSDGNSASIHRFQAVGFNALLGVWFLVKVLHNLGDLPVSAQSIIPDIDSNNLILLGLSSGAYAALKTIENNSETPPRQGDALKENEQKRICG